MPAAVGAQVAGVVAERILVAQLLDDGAEGRLDLVAALDRLDPAAAFLDGALELAVLLIVGENGFQLPR